MWDAAQERPSLRRPSMKWTLAFLIVLAVAPAGIQGQTRLERADTVAGMELYSAFWLNLHHLLHAEARDARNRIDTIRLTAQERSEWNGAVRYYSMALAPKDLRRGQGMTAISDLLATAEALPHSGITPAHRAALAQAAPIYRRHRWLADDSANRRWIARTATLLRRIAPRVLPPLSEFYRVPWYREDAAIRVDVVHVGSARGAYTWTRPRVHSVVDAADATVQEWLGVEMLLHEASHGLTGPLTATIDSAASAAGKETGLLWHAVQFFVVGEVMRRVLAADGVPFTPYLYSTGLFDRAWSHFRPSIEARVSQYLDGRISLHDALERIVAEI